MADKSKLLGAWLVTSIDRSRTVILYDHGNNYAISNVFTGGYPVNIYLPKNIAREVANAILEGAGTPKDRPEDRILGVAASLRQNTTASISDMELALRQGANNLMDIYKELTE